MELYDDALERIEYIEIKNGKFTVTFDDNTLCVLGRTYPADNISCISVCGLGCRIKHGDAIRIIQLCLSLIDEPPVVLEPDWISKITKSGRGWEIVEK